MTTQTELQKFVTDSIIELFEIDLNPIGVSEVFYLTPQPDPSTGVRTWNGNDYIAFPIQGEGWEKSMDGAVPQPTLRVSNITKLLQGYLTQYQDLVGALVRRTLVFEGLMTSGTEKFGEEIFVIYQLESHSKNELVFKLSSILDNKKKFPAKQVLRGEFPGMAAF